MIKCKMKNLLFLLFCAYICFYVVNNYYINFKTMNLNNANQIGIHQIQSPIKQVNSNNIVKSYNFILNYQGKTYQLNFDSQVDKSTNFMINEQAKKWGRDGDHSQAVFALQSLISMGVPPSTAFEFVFPTINKQLDKILDKINILPKDSKIIFTPNFAQKFIITNERCGYIVDKEKLLYDIFKKFVVSPQVSVVLQTDKVQPEITKEDNIENTKLLSKFSTSIATSTSNRRNNVKLALKQFNGMIVQPNQVVSFNQTTGRRTEDKGYKSANIILDGLFVDGTGGGVCQSSTTLYNALLLADNVEILEANRHSMPVSYVKLGFDAMVAYGSSDLKFKNVGSTPIYIRTYSSGDNVNVEIYGKVEKENVEKVRRSEIIKTIKSKGDIVKNDKNNQFSHLMDENGNYRQKFSKDGYEVQTYLDYYNNGKLIETKKVRHTTYPAQQGIVYKGKPKPKEIVESNEIKENENFVLTG